MPTAEVIRRVTHDGVFTKDNPVLQKQSTELAKEQAGHWDTQSRVSLVVERCKNAWQASYPYSILKSRLPSKSIRWP